MKNPAVETLERIRYSVADAAYRLARKDAEYLKGLALPQSEEDSLAYALKAIDREVADVLALIDKKIAYFQRNDPE